MPDITCCKGGACVLQTMCHRYTVKPNEIYQSYFEKPPYELIIINDKTPGIVVTKCEYFWNDDSLRKQKKQDERN